MSIMRRKYTTRHQDNETEKTFFAFFHLITLIEE